jgi:hypothetical protein
MFKKKNLFATEYELKIEKPEAAALLLVSVILFGLCATPATAQNRTRVLLPSIQKEAVRKAVESVATGVLTEMNAASFNERQPNFPDSLVTENAQQRILARWDSSRFRCLYTTLTTERDGGEGPGVVNVVSTRNAYEVQSIPLQTQSNEMRRGILRVSAEGKVLSFRFASEAPVLAREEVTEDDIRATARILVQTEGLEGENRKQQALEKVAAEEGLGLDQYRQIINKVPAKVQAAAREIRDRQREDEAPSTSLGTLVLRTDPSNASIDGPFGRRRSSPARYEKVVEGRYTFTIQREGYQTIQDTTFRVTAGETMTHSMQLRPAFGTVRIENLSDESTVYINGRVQEGQSFSVRADRSHTLALSRPCFETRDTSLVVRENQEVVVNGQLTPVQVPLVARSDPANAKVLVNGKTAGITSFRGSVNACRTHSVQVVKDGHIPGNIVNVSGEPGTAIEHTSILYPFETVVKSDAVSLVNAAASRFNGDVEVSYDLEGQPGEKYEVSLVARGRDGSSIDIDDEDVRGAVGDDIPVGADRRIVWSPGIPEGSTVQLVVREPRGNRLLYVLGGALATGVATTLTVLLSGGNSGNNGDGGSSFPDPPGLPQD